MLSYTACPDKSGKSRKAGKTFLQALFFFLLVTQICFAQWVQVGLNDESIKEIAVQNLNIFAVTSDNGKLYRSNDSGTNWTIIVDSTTRDIEISPSGKLFIVKEDSLWSSSDNGNSWVNTNIKEQLIDSIYYPIYFYPANITSSPTGNLFCTLNLHASGSTNNRDHFATSIDDGLTWTTPGLSITGGRIFSFRSQMIITFGGMYSWWANSYIGYFFLSSDNGNTWTYLGTSPYSGSGYNTINALEFFSNGNIIIGQCQDVGAIYLSTDTCSTWIKKATLTPQCGLSLSNSYTEGILIGTEDSGLILFSDEGDSLGLKNEGLMNLNVQVLALDNNGYIYAGTVNGVWKRNLNELVVPVELTSFTATANGQEVTLNWSTATELNNQGFEVQRKFGSNDFLTVGSVRGNGTTTTPHNYTYVDKLFDAGKYFYRLKQIDYGGKFEYSQTVEVNWSPVTTYKLEQNYPNPFNPTTTIGFGIPEKGNVRLSILNILGEEIKILMNEEKEAGYHSIDFDASGLPSGIYFYKLVTKDFISVKKMMLVK